MAAPLLLLGLTAAAGVGTGMYVFKAGANAPELRPTIMGVPAVPALAIGGAALALMSSGWLAPIGLGIAIGSLVSGQALGQSKIGLDALAAGQVQQALGPPQPPYPPALPGPAYQPPAPSPAAAPGGGLLNWLFQPQPQPS